MNQVFLYTLLHLLTPIDRYYNCVPVDKRVFKNVGIFMENKKDGDDLFDRLDTSSLNKVRFLFAYAPSLI